MPLAAVHRRQAQGRRARRTHYQTVFARRARRRGGPNGGAAFHAGPARGGGGAGARTARHPACGSGHVPAREGGRHRRAPMHSERATLTKKPPPRSTKCARAAAASWRSAQRRCVGWRARRARAACIAPFCRRNEHLHHAWLSLSRGRCAANQFSSAALDPVHAGLGFQG